MPVFIAESNKGKLSLRTDYNRARFSDFLKENDGIRLKIEALTPESSKQRGFYHGAVITLWAFLDGKDYRDSGILNQYHEVAKREYNGEIVMIGGKAQKVGKTTKGKLQQHIDTVIDMLEEQYGIDRSKVLNSESYKYFRDCVYSDGQHDTFIDYLIDLKILNIPLN